MEELVACLVLPHHQNVLAKVRGDNGAVLQLGCGRHCLYLSGSQEPSTDDVFAVFCKLVPEIKESINFHYFVIFTSEFYLSFSWY